VNPLTALAESTKTLRSLRLVQKANPSQALGGIIIPNEGAHANILDLGMDTDKLIKQGWKANIFAYTCVDRLASAVSQVYWRVEKRTGSGEKDWEPDPNDWRQKLLNYPMGKTLSAQEVFYYFAAWLAIKGNGLLRATAGGPNGIVELIPMSPKNLSPVPSKADWISGYNYIEDGEVKWNVPADEVIHARLPDPSDPLWGFGMLEAAFPYVESDSFAAKWRKDTYRSGGVPPAAVIDEDLSAANVDIEAVSLQSAFRRNALNKVPMLLGGKKQIVEFGFSASDMGAAEDRGLTRDEIITAFGMHPAMFSNVAATFDNMDTAWRYLYENGGMRLLAAIRDALNGFLLSADELESDAVYINFDLSQIPYFRRQREARIAGMGAAVRSGITVNEYNNISDLGLPDLTAEEGGDARFMEPGLVLLSEAASGVTSVDAAAATSIPAGQPVPDDLGSNLPQSQDIQVTQDAVLNGAQITAATAIVAAVAAGELPRDAGIGQLMVLFNLESSQAELMMGSAGTTFVPASITAAQNQPPPVVTNAPTPE
jgi:HK97 family phage portal protein